MEVYISVSELFGESKAINICKKLRNCTDNDCKNLDKEKNLFWVKEIGKLQDFVPSFLSSVFVFAVLCCLDKFCNFKTELVIIILRRKARKSKISFLHSVVIM